MTFSDPNRTVIVSFSSVHEVIRAERLANEFNLKYQIVPIPEELSSDCGMCLEIKGSDIELLIAVLQKHNIMHQINSH